MAISRESIIGILVQIPLDCFVLFMLTPLEKALLPGSGSQSGERWAPSGHHVLDTPLLLQGI